MKIAIVGGGISGISAGLYLSKFRNIKKKNITMFTLEVGGDFLKGGLKYLKVTDKTKYFMDSFKINYEIKKTIGAILNFDFNHFPVNKIYSFPEYMYYISSHQSDVIQRQYWKKTGRDEDSFDDRCMNDFKNFRTDLYFSFDKIKLFNKFILELNDRVKIKFGKLNKEKINKIIDNFDRIIYTLPVKFIIGDLPDDKKFNKDLKIYRYKISNELRKKIWFDYIYVPGDKYHFHRMSVGDITADFEFNDSDFEHTDEWSDFTDANNFLDSNFNGLAGRLMDKFMIKGQISKDITDFEKYKISKKIILLGRYAELNKRITWDMVIEKLSNLIL